MQKQSRVNVYLAYIASILMIIGVNLPLYITKVNGDKIVAISRLDNEGILLLMSAIVVIMLRYAKRKKYILIPIVFQLGIMVYYFYIFMTDSKFDSIHVGFVLEVAAIVFLIISMFVNIDVKEEKIRDLSTMRTFNIEDEYKDTMAFKDLTWLVMSIVITSIVIVLKIKINENTKGVVTSSIPEGTTYAKETDIEEKVMEYECDKYALGVSNVYISNENNIENVYLEIKVKNKMKEAIVFSQLFDIRVEQEGINLLKCNASSAKAYDINNIYFQINPGKTSTAYMAFTLKKSGANVKIYIDEINGISKNQVFLKEFDMNKMYYVDTMDEVMEINRKIDKKIDKQNDKKEDSKKKEDTTVKDKDNEKDSTIDKNTTDKKDVTNQESKDNINNANNSDNNQTSSEQENTTTTKKEPQDSETEQNEPVEEEEEEDDDEEEQVKQNLISGLVKFRKPSSWPEEESVVLCLYNNENDTEEYSRIEKSNYGNDTYSFLVHNIEDNKAIYITFNNGTEKYPKEGKYKLVIGKTYLGN